MTDYYVPPPTPYEKLRAAVYEGVGLNLGVGFFVRVVLIVAGVAALIVLRRNARDRIALLSQSPEDPRRFRA